MSYGRVADIVFGFYGEMSTDRDASELRTRLCRVTGLIDLVLLFAERKCSGVPPAFDVHSKLRWTAPLGAG